MIGGIFMITWQWLAGFFDGEGSISISKYPFHVRLEICQSPDKILKEIQKFLGYGWLHYKKKNLLVCGLQFCSDTETAKLLKKLLPYLRVKHFRAKFALQFLNYMEGCSGCPLSQKEIRWRNMHHQLMKIYNKKRIQ